MRTPSRLVVGAAGLIVGASVATGGAALATSGHSPSAPSVTRTATATTATTARSGHLDQVLNDLVKSGTITAAQKAKILAALGTGEGKHSGGVRFGQPLKIVADAIGITPTQLRTELKSGKTVAQVAAAHGVSRATLKAKLTKAADDRLGKLIDRLLDRTLPAKGQVGTNKAPASSSAS